MKKLTFFLLTTLLQFGLIAQNCLNVDISTSDALCHNGNDGSISINVNSGNSPYTYNWGGSSHVSGDEYTIDDLSAGVYTISIFDANGCDYEGHVSIAQPDSLKQSVSGFLCGAGCWCISSQAMGGTPPYSYEWSNGDQTATVIYCDSSTYTITITDANGCQVSGATSVAIVAVPFGISTFNISPIVCGRECTGGVSMQLFGGIPPYTYNWSSGETTKDVLGLCAGEAFVTIVDATLHAITKSFQIPENTPINVENIQLDYVNDCGTGCDGALSVEGIGGFPPYNYFWNGDNGFTASDKNITNVCEGLYTLTVFDSLGCSYTRDFSMLCESQALSATHTIVQPSCPTCCDGSIQVNPVGGFAPYKFKWDDTPFNVDNIRNDMCEGTYTTTITDENGDIIEETIILEALTTAIHEVTVGEVLLNPNPVSNACVLQLELKEQSNITAFLSDISGKQISTVLDNHTIPAGAFHKEISLTNQPSGLYFLSVIFADGTHSVKKIIKI